jgi:hypothetical protein
MPIFKHPLKLSKVQQVPCKCCALGNTSKEKLLEIFETKFQMIMLG